MRWTKEALEPVAGFLLVGGGIIGLSVFMLYGLGAAENTSNLVKLFLYGLLALPIVFYLPFRVYLKNRGFLRQIQS